MLRVIRKLLVAVALLSVAAFSFWVGVQLLFGHLITRWVVAPVAQADVSRVDPALEGQLVYVHGVPDVSCEDATYGVRTRAMGLLRDVQCIDGAASAPEEYLQSHIFKPELRMGAYTLWLPESSSMFNALEEPLPFPETPPAELRFAAHRAPGAPAKLHVRSSNGHVYAVSMLPIHLLYNVELSGRSIAVGDAVELICRQQGDTLTPVPDMRARMELARVHSRPTGLWVWGAIAGLITLSLALITTCWAYGFGALWRLVIKQPTPLKRSHLIISGVCYSIAFMAIFACLQEPTHCLVLMDGADIHAIPLGGLLPPDYGATCQQIASIIKYIGLGVLLFLLLHTLIRRAKGK